MGADVAARVDGIAHASEHDPDAVKLDERGLPGGHRIE